MRVVWARSAGRGAVCWTGRGLLVGARAAGRGASLSHFWRATHALETRERQLQPHSHTPLSAYVAHHTTPHPCAVRAHLSYLLLSSVCSMADVAAAAAAAPAAAGMSRAEKLAAKKQAAELEAEQRALAEQLAALNVGGLASTLEQSLDKHLQQEHDAVAFEAVKKEYDPNFKAEDLRYDDEDMLDAEFWEHGVTAPDADDLKKAIEAVPAGAERLKDIAALRAQHEKDWITAYRQLELKFIKRAIFANDLKRVFAKKRQEVRSHTARGPHRPLSPCSLLLFVSS